jgi:hypothetical protein
MKTKDKIEELERRIKELEARPQYVPIYWPIYVQPAPMPAPNPWYVQPCIPYAPVTYPMWISGNPTTCGGGANPQISFTGGSAVLYS